MLRFTFLRQVLQRDSEGSKSSIDSMEEAEVAEVEMLLEAYDLHMEQTLSRLQTLDEFIQDTEDLVNTALDQKRNEVWINSVTGFCEGD